MLHRRKPLFQTLQRHTLQSELIYDRKEKRSTRSTGTASLWLLNCSLWCRVMDLPLQRFILHLGEETQAHITANTAEIMCEHSLAVAHTKEDMLEDVVSVCIETLCLQRVLCGYPWETPRRLTLTSHSHPR